MEASGIIMVNMQVRTVDHDDVLATHSFYITFFLPACRDLTVFSPRSCPRSI
jgi:hypothetical protein